MNTITRSIGAPPATPSSAIPNLMGNKVFNDLTLVVLKSFSGPSLDSNGKAPKGGLFRDLEQDEKYSDGEVKDMKKTQKKLDKYYTQPGFTHDEDEWYYMDLGHQWEGWDIFLGRVSE